MEPLAKILSGGNPRGLGRAAQAVELVNARPDNLAELFDCLSAEDEIVRMRAGDALEKVCRQHPDWFEPYKKRLLEEVAESDQPSVQWHLAQMLGELNLNKKETAQALVLLFKNLDESSDWIVINYSLEVLAQFAREDSSTKRKLLTYLKKFKDSRYKSISSRASRLLDSLEGHKL